MKPRNPPRRTNSTQLTSSKTAPRILYAGRAEQPTVNRHPGESTPWKLVGIILVLVVGAALGTSKMWQGGTFSNVSSYAQTYEIRNVELKSDGVIKGRVRWNISAQIMNATSEEVKGPRLRVRLVRADDTVAAEGVADYSNRKLAQSSGFTLTYMLETASVDTVQAEITVLPRREGAYDRSGE